MKKTLTIETDLVLGKWFPKLQDADKTERINGVDIGYDTPDEAVNTYALALFASLNPEITLDDLNINIDLESGSTAKRVFSVGAKPYVEILAPAYRRSQTFLPGIAIVNGKVTKHHEIQISELESASVVLVESKPTVYLIDDNGGLHRSSLSFEETILDATAKLQPQKGTNGKHSSNN